MAQDPRVLVQKAEKAQASAGSGFSFFGGKTEKYENAADLWTQAANAFKLQSNGKEAGLAFERAATIQEVNLNEPMDAANSLVEASKAYRKTDPEDCVRCLDKAIGYYTGKGGNFRRAATFQQQKAEILEEVGQDHRALESYETAANWYEGDNAQALANKLWLKVADLSGLEGDYYKGIDNYEKVAKSSINNNLMKWSVKSYLLNAGILRLATGDMVGFQKGMEMYRDLDPAFPTTREHQFLNDLATSIEEGDQEKFGDASFQFNQMSQLDKWKTSMLLRIKNQIQEQGEDFS